MPFSFTRPHAFRAGQPKENSPKEYIMKVTYTQKEGRMILTTTSKSGAYERYIAAEWGESKDGAFELELEKKFLECKVRSPK